MYEIKHHISTIDGVPVDIWSRELVNACMMRVYAGTTGYRGGDSGHGGRTFIRLVDDGGTDMEIVPSHDPEGVEIVFEGDAELTNIVDALKFAVHVLEDQIQSQHDK